MRIVMYTMPNQKNKKNSIKKLKKDISESRKASPENVDWELCANTVDSLHVWIEELCTENHKLKQLLSYVIERLKDDNAQTKKILSGLEPEVKKLTNDSKDNKKQ